MVLEGTERSSRLYHFALILYKFKVLMLNADSCVIVIVAILMFRKHIIGCAGNGCNGCFQFRDLFD